MQQESLQVQQCKYTYCLGVQCLVIATRPNVHVDPDPYAYSSGRWLCWDKSERESRYIQFNFSALCKRAIALCPGAKSIASYEKKEGGYNRVFIFTMDNTRRVVARLPTRLSGPPGLTTNSEVATIKYCRFQPSVVQLCSRSRLCASVQSETTIPIPNILEWKDFSTNDVGSEYIIMEHAKGTQLHQIWPAMSLKQQVACTGAIVRNIKQMAAINFHTYGSLYFDNVRVDSVMKHPVTPGYVIGPHCGTTFWDCEVREPRYYSSARTNRGPCKS